MPPFQYDWSRTPKSYIDKNDKIGLLIGSILAGGMGAASGQGGGDSALRGVAGAAAGFGGGANQLEDTYSKMIDEKMKRDQQDYEQNMGNEVFGLNKEKFGQQKKQYEESELPESRARMESYNKFGYLGSPPNSIIEDEYSQRLSPERRQDFDKYAAPVSVPILAERAARGDKIANEALSHVNVPQLYNSDQGVKLINRRTEQVKDTGLTQKPEISDTAIEKFGTINTLQQSVNDLSLLSEKVSMGPAAGRLEQAKGNWFNNLSSDEQLEFNTINQQIFNVIGELRGGKVLTENEMARLLAELPNQNLPYKTYKVRLKMLNRYLDRTLENKMKTYEQGNYNVEGIDRTTGQKKTAEEYLSKFK